LKDWPLSTNSIFDPSVSRLVAIAAFLLPGQLASAHEEHKKKPAPTPAAEPSSSHLSHAHEYLFTSLLIGATDSLGGSLLYGVDHLAWYRQ
jgi:hypothetical protein